VVRSPNAAIAYPADGDFRFWKSRHF
jgi:hypothetical protein